MLVDFELSRRLERTEASASASFVDSRARLRPAAKAEWTEICGAYLMFDGVESPITQTFGLGMFDPVTETDLDRMEAFFRDRGAAVNHEVSPLAGVALHRRLADRGYVPLELTSVMCMSLERRAAVAAPPPGIRVRPTGPEEADLFAQTSARGWSELADFREMIEDLGRIVASRPEAPGFIAELTADNTPIGTGAFFMHEGVALLAGASTIPEYRKRGAQKALLEARLEYSAAHGCTVAMMCAEPGSGSQRNAQRQGFQICYTRTKWMRE